MKKKNLLMTAIAIFGLATITMAQVPNYVPTNGLVGWWPFNGNANDESGNGNNGTVNGATLTSDRFGSLNSCYSFIRSNNDGVNYSSIQSLYSGTNSFSISLWFKSNNVSYSEQNILRNGLYGGQGNIGLAFYVTNYYSGPKKLTILVGDGVPLAIQATSFQEISDSLWYHGVAVIDRSSNELKLYINGFLENTSSISQLGTIFNQNQFWMGKDYFQNTKSFDGLIDDLGYWNRALTQCEIQDLYNAQLNSGSMNISAGLDQTLCSGDSVTLSASGGSNYQWSNNVLDGQPFVPSQSNAYVVNGTDSLGCQGSDTLMITVLENATSTLNETTLDSYTLNGQTYTESGTYTQTVPAANGCDSVITLNLTLNFTGLSQEESTLFVLYPNPASEQITIKTDAGMIGKEYALYNQVGKLITKGKLTGENTSLSLQGLARGMYSIAIQGQEKKSFTISKE